MTRSAVGFDGTIVQLTHVKRTKIEIETPDRKRREKIVQVYLGPIGKRRVIVRRQDEMELRFQIVGFPLSFPLRDGVQE
jgi:hypothetical protein